MPIVKCDNFIEVYRNKARSKNINELSGRPGRPDLTQFVSQSILLEVDIKQADVLVDIGCGDGSLLKIAAPKIFSGIGILPTEEEVGRVRKNLVSASSKIRIQKGLVQQTKLDSAVADKIVCNGVIILLVEPEVNIALRELVRIAKPGAVVFIGEVPQVNEFEGKTYGNSIILWLWWVLRKQGVSAFIQCLGQTFKSFVSSEPFIIAPKPHFYERREQFIERAEKCGLSLKSSFYHQEGTRDNHVASSKTRLDYVFTVVKNQ